MYGAVRAIVALVVALFVALRYGRKAWYIHRTPTTLPEGAAPPLRSKISRAGQ